MITCHFVKSLVSNHLLELLRLQDLIHGFLHQGVDPDTTVCRYEVHQSELGDDLILVDVELAVHEEIVHLHEGEDHVEHRVDAGEDVPRTAAHRNLEKLGETCCRNHLEEVDKLQPCVD